MVSKLGTFGTALAIVAVVAMMLAGMGSRLGWWYFRTGFTVLKGSAYLALFAASVSLAGLIVAAVQKIRDGIILGVLGLLIGLAAAWVPWSFVQTARSVPPIHDITTDTENPPAFVAVLPLREGSPNPAEYGGPEVAAQQRSAYPGLGPKVLSVQPDAAFKQALAAARDMGWEIVDANEAEMRIEATDTTLWFGFKDDIVVRVTPDDGGSRVDLRSVSRVGKSDVGANAKRISRFLERLPP